MQSRSIMIIALLAASFLAGCSFHQMRMEFIGIEPSDVTSSKDKYVRVLDGSPEDLFDKAKTEISEMGAFVEKEDRARLFMVALKFNHAFHSAIDTTRVGLVFSAEEGGKTKIEVASGNKRLAEFVSSRIFEKGVD